jgi:hypothetical protein
MRLPLSYRSVGAFVTSNGSLMSPKVRSIMWLGLPTSLGLLGTHTK